MPWYALAVLASVAISEFTRPVPDDAPKPGMEDLRRNKSSQAKRVPVVWGKPINSVANMAWYGGLQTKEIKRKIKGLFKSDEVVSGYQYSLTQHLILSAGSQEADSKILKIWCNDKLVFPDQVAIALGTQSATAAKNGIPQVAGKKKGAVQIAAPYAFGGEGKGGGVVGLMTYYVGCPGQGVDEKLQELIGKPKKVTVPEFNRVAHCVWTGYIGDTGQIPQWTFQQQRIPKKIPAGNGYDPELHAEIRGEANAAEMLYELIIDQDWGMGLDPEFLVNIAFFQKAARRLYDDEMGLSMLWDQGKSMSAVIKEILRHIDAALYVNSITGRFELKLIRPVTDFTNIKVFNKHNCKLTSFSRPNMDELANEVKIIWSDIKNKKDKVHMVQDTGNHQAQDKQIISTEIRYPGFTRLSIVKRVGVRDLKRASYPLARASLDNVAREAYTLTPGDRIVIDFPEHDINQILMVVNEIDYGDYKDRKIVIECVQDVSLIPDYEGELDDSSLWEPSGTAAEKINVSKLTSRPYFYNLLDDDQKKKTQFKPMLMALDPTEASLGFKVMKSIGSNGASPPKALKLETGLKPFTPAGVLLQDLKRSDGVTEEGIVFRLTTAPLRGTLDSIESLDNPEDIQVDGKNMVMIGDEIIAIKSLEYLSSTRTYDDSSGRFIRITEAWRAMLDSTQPAVHPAGTPVWFFSLHHASLQKPSFPDSVTSIRMKFLTETTEEALAAADVDDVVMDNTKRAKRPYPVKNVHINGEVAPIIINGVDADITWNWDNRLATKDDAGVATEDDTVMARRWDAVSITPESSSTLKIQLFDSYGVEKYTSTVGSGTNSHSIPWAEIEDADEALGYLEIRLTARAGASNLPAPFYDSIYFRKTFAAQIPSALDKFYSESAHTYWAFEE